MKDTIEEANYTSLVNGTSFVNFTIFDDEIQHGVFDGLNVPYALVEILVAVFAVLGNAAVIIVFQQEKRLHRRTNYYIVSLAFADFLVGLFGVPFAIMASVGLPRNLHACLGTITLLVVLCTISIFCLVGVSIDRYWAILYPIKYSKNVSTKTAISKYMRYTFSPFIEYHFYRNYQSVLDSGKYYRISTTFWLACSYKRRPTMLICGSHGL